MGARNRVRRGLSKVKKLAWKNGRNFFFTNTILKFLDFYFALAVFLLFKENSAIFLIEKIVSLIIQKTIHLKRSTCLHQLGLVLLQDRSGLILKAINN
jgi:hypothetical protein